ncbi:MAG: methylmalonyl Co-A mutase-associated GTPase MeaB [Saprospiraceae bacterium]|nr:methylmalonyl Co-A mutase-associated GTPase MeaB [Saprospiraceae bacterium]
MQRTPVNALELFHRLRQGDRVALGRAITLIESTRPSDRLPAAELIEACLPHTGRSVRLGISGTPGAGKSTLIDAYGTMLTRQGHPIAVLAIDPSSGVHKGSILGDKTRMDRLSRDPKAFIRPSPAGTTLGGVARKTRDTILLCEAAGFDHILIETVGVGQSETAVQAMTDLFLLLLIPGAGDELQGIKRGIVEMADIVVINKADGDRLRLAEDARMHYRRALHLYPARDSGLPVPVLLISALEQTGLDELDQRIRDHIQAIRQNGHFQRQRQDQAGFWLRESLMDQLSAWVFEQHGTTYNDLHQAVLEGQISPFAAADILMRKITGRDPD